MTVARARQFRRRMSPPEAALWVALRSEPLKQLHFRRQVSIGPYYADFASHRAKLVIEVDGRAHSTDSAILHDQKRGRLIDAEGYRVLRVTTVDVLSRLDAVVQTILGMTSG
jgi:very-short-patch-repair endonuclease